MSGEEGRSVGKPSVNGMDGTATIDHANQDYISGWAFDKGGVLEIDVFVEDERVGSANYGSYRADVAKVEPDAARSGFSFLFPPGGVFNSVHAKASVLNLRSAFWRIPAG